MSNPIDNVIGFFNPKAGAKRMQARAHMLSMKEQVRRYDGAEEGRRASSWRMKNNPSVNQLVGRDLRNLVNRSRELSLNNPYAKKAPSTIANNVVGAGILAKPYIADAIIDGKIVKAKNTKKLLELVNAFWKDWAETKTCDYNGDFNFYGIQYLVMRTWAVSGEVLIIRKRVPVAVNKYGFQIIVLEGDYIDPWKNTTWDTDGGYTSNGVKYDKNNRKIGYWLFDRHPSEAALGGPKDFISKLVNIEDIIHIRDVERPGQNRGVPLAASTLVKAKDLDDYEDAELFAKKSTACMPYFVENADPDATNAATDDKLENVEPGMVWYLNPHEKVTFAAPPQNPGYEGYTKTQHRAIAAGYNMSYETYSGDLSNVNFSSGRMGWLEFNRQVQHWQYTMLIPNLCEGVFAWFVDNLKIARYISDELNVKANWTPPRREMIDPVKETQAKRTALRAGLISWQEMVRQDGYDPDELLVELEADAKIFKEKYLVFDWFPYFELTLKAEAGGHVDQEGQPEDNATSNKPAKGKKNSKQPDDNASDE